MDIKAKLDYLLSLDSESEILEFKEAKNSFDWAGHYYGRDGEELNALNLEELERIRKQDREDDWSIGICEKADISDLQIKQLRQKKLIEGRRPNFHISSRIAKKTGQKDDYMKMRGIDDDYCK